MTTTNMITPWMLCLTAASLKQCFFYTKEKTGNVCLTQDNFAVMTELYLEELYYTTKTGQCKYCKEGTNGSCKTVDNKSWKHTKKTPVGLECLEGSPTLFRLPDVDFCNSNGSESYPVTTYSPVTSSIPTEAWMGSFNDIRCTGTRYVFGAEGQDRVSTPFHLQEAASLTRHKECENRKGIIEISNPMNTCPRPAFPMFGTWIEEATDCTFVKGSVWKNSAGELRTNLGVLDNCKMVEKECSSNEGIIVWKEDPGTEITHHEDYTGSAYIRGNHLLFPGHAASYVLNMTFTGPGRYYSTDGYKLEIGEPYSASNPKPKYSSSAVYAEDLENTVQYLMDYISVPTNMPEIMCSATSHTLSIIRHMIPRMPTEIARSIFNKDSIVARASENFLAVWNCRSVNYEARIVQGCWKDLPAKWKRDGKIINGFRSPITGQLLEKSQKVECDMNNVVIYEEGDDVFMSIGPTSVKLNQDEVQSIPPLGGKEGWLYEFPPLNSTNSTTNIPAHPDLPEPVPRPDLPQVVSGHDPYLVVLVILSLVLHAVNYFGRIVDLIVTRKSSGGSKTIALPENMRLIKL